MSTDKRDSLYLKMAEVWAQNSHANRSKVGALIVSKGVIISDGYNGTPAGFDNECEKTEWDNDRYIITVTKPEVLHAEANAITKLAKSTSSSESATLYVTLSPCFECAKLIIQSGIKRVVYKTKYRKSDGLDLLLKAGIIIDHINID